MKETGFRFRFACEQLADAIRDHKAELMRGYDHDVALLRAGRAQLAREREAREAEYQMWKKQQLKQLKETRA